MFFYKFLLKWAKMKKILSPAYSLKLNIYIYIYIYIYIESRLNFFFKWSYSQHCIDVAQRCENRR